jgi:hypothetical protein
MPALPRTNLLYPHPRGQGWAGEDAHRRRPGRCTGALGIVPLVPQRWGQRGRGWPRSGGGVVDASMGPGVLKRQLSVRGGDVSKVGSMVILDVDVSLLRDDEITLWQSEGDLQRASGRTWGCNCTWWMVFSTAFLITILCVSIIAAVYLLKQEKEGLKFQL